jgi:hypothetical protein
VIPLDHHSTHDQVIDDGIRRAIVIERGRIQTCRSLIAQIQQVPFTHDSARPLNHAVPDDRFLHI